MGRKFFLNSTCILALVDPLGTDLDLGTDEVAIEELPIFNVVQLCNFLARNRVVHLAGFFTTLLLEPESYCPNQCCINSFEICTYVISPKIAIDAVSLNAFCFSSRLKPSVSKATSVNSNSSASSMESTFTFPCEKLQQVASVFCRRQM